MMLEYLKDLAILLGTPILSFQGKMKGSGVKVLTRDLVSDDWKGDSS